MSGFHGWTGSELTGGRDEENAGITKKQITDKADKRQKQLQNKDKADKHNRQKPTKIRQKPTNITGKADKREEGRMPFLFFYIPAAGSA